MFIAVLILHFIEVIEFLEKPLNIVERALKVIKLISFNNPCFIVSSTSFFQYFALLPCQSANYTKFIVRQHDIQIFLAKLYTHDWNYLEQTLVPSV